MTQRTIAAAAVLLMGLSGASRGSAAQASRDNSETMLVICHAKAGAEADLERVLERHWQTVKRLDLVRESPHVRVRGRENGQTFFVEIFAWRDADIPDNAPAEVRAIWAEMQALAEKRDGHDGIEITEVSLVTPPEPTKR